MSGKGSGLGTSGDRFYEALIASHRGLSDKESQDFNARLILLMANEIGDLAKLQNLLSRAGKAQTQS